MVTAVTLIAAAVLLYSAWPKPHEKECTENWGGESPLVVFGPQAKIMVTLDNFTLSWNVKTVYCQGLESFSAWKGAFLRDGQVLSPPRTLVENTIIPLGANVNLIVTDGDGNGKLTPGDTFFFYGMPMDHNWRFSLVWGADGSEIQSASWAT